MPSYYDEPKKGIIIIIIIIDEKSKIQIDIREQWHIKIELNLQDQIIYTKKQERNKVNFMFQLNKCT